MLTITAATAINRAVRLRRSKAAATRHARWIESSAALLFHTRIIRIAHHDSTPAGFAVVARPISEQAFWRLERARGRA